MFLFLVSHGQCPPSAYITVLAVGPNASCSLLLVVEGSSCVCLSDVHVAFVVLLKSPNAGSIAGSIAAVVMCVCGDVCVW